MVLNALLSVEFLCFPSFQDQYLFGVLCFCVNLVVLVLLDSRFSERI